MDILGCSESRTEAGALFLLLEYGLAFPFVIVFLGGLNPIVDLATG
jgi:hypothetical protein